MKAYHEYLERFSYFARSGEVRLGSAEFETAWKEWKALVAKHPALVGEERARFFELKAALFEDKP